MKLGPKYSSNKITKQSLHRIYQKRLHVFVKVVTSIFRSLPNLTKVKFDQVFKLYSLFLLKIGSTTVFTVPFWTIHIWTLPIWTVVVWMVIFLAFLTENYGNWYLGSLYIETIGFRRSADENGFFILRNTLLNAWAPCAFGNAYTTLVVILFDGLGDLPRHSA